MERPQFHGTHLEDFDGAVQDKDKERERERERERDKETKGSKGSGSGSNRGGREDGGELRKAYPMWRRLVRYCFTIPPVVAALAVILIVMSTVFTTQDKLFFEYEHNERLNFKPEVTLFSISFQRYITGGAAGNVMAGVSRNSTSTGTPVPASSWGSKISTENLRDPNFWTVTLLYPCIYGILVDVAVKLFALLALRLTNFENHRTQTTFMNRLILKVFSFRFITIFTSLYYYAFFTSDHEGAFVRISVTIFSLITVGQWWGALIDICFPSIVHRLMTYRMKVNVLAVNRSIYRAREYADASEGSRSKALNEAVAKRASYLDQARAACWAEAMMFQYNNFHDYSSIIVQFCFVLFFASVFPLAPLIALLNNICLLRLSAYKICYTRQRPIALKSGGLGVWEDVLQVMSVVGILTNCGIMGYTSTVLQTHLTPVIGMAGMVVALFALEHAILFLKYWLSAAVPRVPITVQRAQARDRRSMGRRKQVRQEEKKKRRTHLSDHFYPFYDEDQDDGGVPETWGGEYSGYDITDLCGEGFEERDDAEGVASSPLLPMDVGTDDDSTIDDDADRIKRAESTVQSPSNPQPNLINSEEEAGKDFHTPSKVPNRGSGSRGGEGLGYDFRDEEWDRSSFKEVRSKYMEREEWESERKKGQLKAEKIERVEKVVYVGERRGTEVAGKGQKRTGRRRTSGDIGGRTHDSAPSPPRTQTLSSTSPRTTHTVPAPLPHTAPTPLPVPAPLPPTRGPSISSKATSMMSSVRNHSTLTLRPPPQKYQNTEDSDSDDSSSDGDFDMPQSVPLVGSRAKIVYSKPRMSGRGAGVSPPKGKLSPQGRRSSIRKQNPLPRPPSVSVKRQSTYNIRTRKHSPTKATRSDVHTPPQSLNPFGTSPPLKTNRSPPLQNFGSPPNKKSQRISVRLGSPGGKTVDNVGGQGGYLTGPGSGVKKTQFLLDSRMAHPKSSPDAWQVQFAERVKAIESRKKIYSVALKSPKLAIPVQKTVLKNTGNTDFKADSEESIRLEDNDVLRRLGVPVSLSSLSGEGVCGDLGQGPELRGMCGDRPSVGGSVWGDSRVSSLALSESALMGPGPAPFTLAATAAMLERFRRVEPTTVGCSGVCGGYDQIGSGLGLGSGRQKAGAGAGASRGISPDPSPRKATPSSPLPSPVPTSTIVLAPASPLPLSLPPLSFSIERNRDRERDTRSPTRAPAPAPLSPGPQTPTQCVTKQKSKVIPAQVLVPVREAMNPFEMLTQRFVLTPSSSPAPLPCTPHTETAAVCAPVCVSPSSPRRDFTLINALMGAVNISLKGKLKEEKKGAEVSPSPLSPLTTALSLEQKISRLENQNQNQNQNQSVVSSGTASPTPRGREGRGGRIVRAFSPIRPDREEEREREGPCVSPSPTLSPTPTPTRIQHPKQAFDLNPFNAVINPNPNPPHRLDLTAQPNSVSISGSVPSGPGPGPGSVSTVSQKKVRINQKHHERENIAKVANVPHYQQPIARSAMAGSRAKQVNTNSEVLKMTPMSGPGTGVGAGVSAGGQTPTRVPKNTVAASPFEEITSKF